MPGGVYPGQIYPGQTWPDGTFPSLVPTEGLSVDVAFSTIPNSETPGWFDISGHVLEFQVRRGRQKELDRIDAGSCMLKLLNKDRRFDPTHVLGPYAPYVLPMRRIRIRWTRGATTYPLFDGFIDSWPQTWEGPQGGYSTVQASDGFQPLAKADIGEGEEWPREFSGARIDRVLDAVGWPAADRAIDSGYSEIAAVSYPLGSGVTALGHLQEVADAETGAFFIDGAGKATFHDRHHRRGSSYLTSQATFSDSTEDGLPYSNVILDTSAERIWNDVQIVSPGASVQRAEDTTSQGTYLRRTLARSVPLARETEAADQASHLLQVYKDPRYRFSAIQIDPAADAEYVQALGRELGDHITVKRWPSGIGSQITQECSIEQIEHRGTYSRLQTTWLLSTPAFTAIDWWILEDPTYGKLGVTTKVPY